MAESNSTLSMATKITASYVGHNNLALDRVPALIDSLHKALSRLESGEKLREPAVPIEKSVKRNEVICLECGNGHKMLKRHLSTAHGLSDEEYRKRWELKRDYPLVAPNYAKRRSEMAKMIGLGRKPVAASRRGSKTQNVKQRR